MQSVAISTLLFVSGAQPSRIAKAIGTDADIVCLDLEDSVPADGKRAARDNAAQMLHESPRLALRINPIGTAEGIRDLAMVIDSGACPALLLVPKVSSPAEIAVIRGATAGSIRIVPLIEDPIGLASVTAIAASTGVGAMMFGGGDMAAELGVELAWEPLLPARGAFLLGCAAAGVPAIDVPFIHLADEAGLIEEARRAKAMGFRAKAAIHPAQLDALHAVFRPDAASIAEARAAQAAFAAAGGAAVRFNGRMLEAPIMRRYLQILEQADIMERKMDA